MNAMGVDQAFLYPTWFAEGFHLIEDPDVAYALARDARRLDHVPGATRARGRARAERPAGHR